jgi:hypothetical protein
MKKENKAKKHAADIELRKNPINQFTCCGKGMTLEEFKVHLTEAHKLDHSQMKGKRKMVMHLDGDYWVSYSYEWELEQGLKFTQYIEMARDADDPMRLD